MLNRKSPRKAMLFAAVAGIVIAIAAPAFAGAATTKKEAFAEGVTRFGRAHLAREAAQGDTRLLNAYDAVVTAVGNKVSPIQLGEYNLNADELERVLSVYRSDHGEHYWYPTGYTVNKNTANGKVNYVVADYLEGYNHSRFEEEAQKLLACTQGKEGEYEIALALHDALVTHITYDTGAVRAHDAYGAIVDGRAVCEGYAEAYQYLLGEMGIQSYIVTGSSHGENHAWNLVRLNGNYYYTDVTWDDPVGGDEATKPVYHAYFSIPAKILTEDHDIREDYANSFLPECTRSDMLYKGMSAMEQYTVEGVAGAFVTQDSSSCIARVFFTGGEDNFSEWFNRNYGAVVGKSPMAGKAKHISSSACGREHIITISGDTPVEDPEEKPEEKPADNPGGSENPTGNPTENPEEKPADNPGGSENPTGNPTENPEEKPADNPGGNDAPTDNPADNPADNPGEKPDTPTGGGNTSGGGTSGGSGNTPTGGGTGEAGSSGGTDSPIISNVKGCISFSTEWAGIGVTLGFGLAALTAAAILIRKKSKR